MQGIKGKAILLKTLFVQHKAANLFLLIAVCTGILMAYITPPFQECDGWFHYLLAMDVSYGNLFSPWVNISAHEDGMIYVPENYEDIGYHSTELGTGDGGAFIRHLKGMKFSAKATETRVEAAYVSLFYYPQAFGYFLGRILQMNAFGSVVLSRFFNLLVFLAMSYTAVRITPILQHTMAVIALFPLTLYQASSGSPDAMLNGFCFLFVALCFYYAYGEKEQLEWTDVCRMGILLGIIFLCKYVYICLGVLVFLIPTKKFKTKKDYWKSFAIALIPVAVIGAIGAVHAFSLVALGQPSIETAGMTQTQYLAEHPAFILKVLLATFKHNFNVYMSELNTLGSLNYSMEPLIFIVPMFAVFVGCLDCNDVSSRIKVRDKLICFAAFLLLCAAILVAMYLADGNANKVGALIVEGVQGRYFIPALPVFFAAILQSGLESRVKYFTEKAIGGMGILLIFSLYMLHSYCV